MRRIVLPLSAITTLDVIHTIAAADVRVAVEVVIHIDVDVAATPAATPTPTTAPGSTHGPTNAERDRTGGDHRSR